MIFLLDLNLKFRAGVWIQLRTTKVFWAVLLVSLCKTGYSQDTEKIHLTGAFGLSSSISTETWGTGSIGVLRGKHLLEIVYLFPVSRVNKDTWEEGVFREEQVSYLGGGVNYAHQFWRQKRWSMLAVVGFQTHRIDFVTWDGSGPLTRDSVPSYWRLQMNAGLRMGFEVLPWLNVQQSIQIALAHGNFYNTYPVKDRWRARMLAQCSIGFRL